MNKKILLTVAAILVLAGGGIAYLSLKPKPRPKQAPVQNTATSADTNTPEVASPDNQARGAYIDYKDGIIATTKGTKILFFHAPWCTQCRALEKSIKESAIPGGVTIIKVDYDTQQDLKQKYGVTIQTTLVKVDDAGNFIKKYVAYSQPTFQAVRENLL